MTILARAKASDWTGTELAGSGITFTQANPAARPALVGEALRFDGLDDVLTASFAFGMENKTVALICTPAAGSGAQAGIFNMQGPGGRKLTLEAQAAGFFRARARFAGLGTSAAFVQPTSVTNVMLNQAGQKFCATIQFRPTEAVITSGALTAGVMAIAAGAKPMTTLTLGRAAGGLFCGLDFHELVVIDSIDDAVVNAELAALAAEHQVAVPTYSRWMKRVALIFGDSVSMGAGGDPESNGTIQSSCAALICDVRRWGRAGAQMSPVGLAAPAQDLIIAACGARISADASKYAGVHLVVIHFGGNDFGSDVPIGEIWDTTEATFFGAARITLDNVASLAPGVPVVLSAPFYATDHLKPSGQVRQDFRDALIQIGQARGIPVADMGLAPIDASNVADCTVDGVHPNNAGYALGRDILIPVLRAL